VQQDDDSTRAIYHKLIDQRTTLSGSTPVPQVAESFMTAVRNAGAASAAASK
jgi:hypothetical protein